MRLGETLQHLQDFVILHAFSDCFHVFGCGDAIGCKEQRRVAVSWVKISVPTGVACVVPKSPEEHFVSADGEAVPSLQAVVSVRVKEFAWTATRVKCQPFAFVAPAEVELLMGFRVSQPDGALRAKDINDFGQLRAHLLRFTPSWVNPNDDFGRCLFDGFSPSNCQGILFGRVGFVNEQNTELPFLQPSLLGMSPPESNPLPDLPLKFRSSNL